MENPLKILQDYIFTAHDMIVTASQAQKIVNICAKIIVLQDAQDYEDKTREAIELAGGCSRCGDITGFECICEKDEEREDFEDWLRSIQKESHPRT